MEYYNDYLNLINKGLREVVVTDNNGKLLSTNDGLDIWANIGHRLKDYKDGVMYFCGNGASASMAEHMSHDWFQNGLVNTVTCSELAHVTAISNDLGYEDVFSFRIGRVVTAKDILIGISSSGNSTNIVKAVEVAKAKGAFIITYTGKNEDNKLRHMGDLNFYVPLKTYGEVESAHAMLLHMALDYYMDEHLGGRH